MALTDTFLELAPEFGGTRFGPFKGMEIRLGSDPGSNDITLPENLGVLANHVKLISQGDGSFIVAPVERTAGVFTFRSGGSAKQVTSPVAIQGASDTYSADSFSLVTPEGPRFYVLLVRQQQEGKTKESDFDRAKKRLSGKSLWSELKRQGITMFLTTFLGREVQRWGTFIKTGAIFRPRVLISGAVMAAGWLFTGGLALVACQAAVGQKKVETELTQCNDKVASLGADTNGNPQFEVFIAKVLGENGVADQRWTRALKNDTDFTDIVRQQMSALYKNPKRLDQLRWVYRKKNSDFTKTAKAMKAAGWQPHLVRTMSYLAAVEGSGEDEREWIFLEADSMGAEACGRGPLAVTWRQAQNLGLTGVELDAPLAMSKYASAGDPQKQEALMANMSSLRNFNSDGYTIKEIHASMANNMQEMMCLHDGVENPEETQDPRSALKLEELMKQLNASVGKTGKKVASIDGDNGVLSRLLRYWAADSKGGIDGLDLATEGTMTPILKSDAKPVADYALQKSAETLAKAAIIPCLWHDDKDKANIDLTKTLGAAAPAPMDCIILQGIITYDLR
jgi:hypothetical protein